MKRLLLLLVLAVVFVLPASGSVGWYAKWNCNAPCTLGVDYSAMPQSEWPLIQDAMAKWSQSASIDFVTDFKGAHIKLVPCVAGTSNCGFITNPKYSKQNYTLHGVSIAFSDQWFGWNEMPRIYCHELGHALGFMDGAVEPDPNLPADQTSTSCMASTSSDPGIEDFAMLAKMYPLP